MFVPAIQQEARMSYRSWIAALALTAAAGIPNAMAADSAAAWYLGAGAGQSRAKLNDSSVNAVLAGSGSTAGPTSKDETDVSYKLFLGYQFNKYFAVEGGYFSLGEFSFTTTTVPAGTLRGIAKNHVGMNLDVLGILPLADRFSLYGRLGIQNSKTTDLFSGVAVLNPAPSKNKTDYKLGLGAKFDITKNIGLRGEWERYRVSDGLSGNTDVDVFSASLLYKF